LEWITVAESVETKEQAEFLRDIGCTMFQGFYFSKLMPFNEILEKNENGMKIGFENPSEAEYYTQIGNANLYNLSMIDTDEEHNNNFVTWPMVMVECIDDRVSVVKSNITFKKFVKEFFPQLSYKKEFDSQEFIEKTGGMSLKAVLQCAQTGKREIIDDMTDDGKMIQLFIWRVAVNPVTKVAAVIVAILSSTES